MNNLFKTRSLLPLHVLDELEESASFSPEGNLCEIGVYKGGSALRLYKVALEQNRSLYLYDTFAGIPERSPIDTHGIGDFGDTSLPEIEMLMPQAKIHAGIFPQTLVNMAPLAFTHIDCDQYASILAAYTCLEPMMVQGGVMQFDDYFELEGARQAIDTFKHLHRHDLSRWGKLRLYF